MIHSEKLSKDTVSASAFRSAQNTYGKELERCFGVEQQAVWDKENSPLCFVCGKVT